MATPLTVDEAKKQGYEVKSISREAAERLMSDHKFIAGVEKAPKECTSNSKDQLCWEGDCIGGWKEVLYCDGTMGCTQHARVRC